MLRIGEYNKMKVDREKRLWILFKRIRWKS